LSDGGRVLRKILHKNRFMRMKKLLLRALTRSDLASVGLASVGLAPH
jgi:hypothetical protein